MPSTKYIVILGLLLSCWSEDTKSARPIATESNKFIILAFNIWSGGELKISATGAPGPPDGEPGKRIKLST